MIAWPSAKAKRVLAALERMGRAVKRRTGSYRTLARPGWPGIIFAFHEGEEIGPRMMTRIAKTTGLNPEIYR
uniref:Putative periplasmic or secreted lipoprotein n=1 Tax=Desulfovibrio sp. U5L TaxID=596152 RepID=I2Q5D5_9BACT